MIGFGSPNKANTHGAHGAPLGDDEIKLTKKAYGWPESEKFLVPKEVPEYFQSTLGKRGAECESKWNALFADYKKQFAKEAAQLEALFARQLPAGWDAGLKPFDPMKKDWPPASAVAKS